MSADGGWSRRQCISQIRYLCFILSIYLFILFVRLFVYLEGSHIVRHRGWK